MTCSLVWHTPPTQIRRGNPPVVAWDFSTCRDHTCERPHGHRGACVCSCGMHQPWAHVPVSVAKERLR